jgi:pyruvate/2-oxoglutarate dehydrogenase complex dihydrolipoamide acyltransferase (E2) component
VRVLELLVKVGDQVEKDTPLVTLESDKATMDVPAPAAGKIAAIAIKTGDKVASGMMVMELEGARPLPAEEALDDSPASPRQAEPFGGEPYVETIPIEPIRPGANANRPSTNGPTRAPP